MKPTYHKKNFKRDKFDFYPTPPAFTEALLRHFGFAGILEPCCGDGAICKVITARGGSVRATDIVERGYGGVQDAFDITTSSISIVTNPPYNQVLGMAKHFLHIVRHGRYVALLVRQTFLEGQTRYKLFKDYPPKRVIIISNRMPTSEQIPSSQFGHCWVVWQKGYRGSTELVWEIAK